MLLWTDGLNVTVVVVVAGWLAWSRSFIRFAAPGWRSTVRFNKCFIFSARVLYHRFVLGLVQRVLEE